LLIGNLTRDPELRYTPAGMAVTSFGLATNRVWVTKQGERKEDAQFHRIVAWNKLAELCSQLLSKGRRIYVEGRIQYREITDQSGVRKQVSEIVIDDMIILDNKGVNRNSEQAEVDLIETEAPVKVEEETAVGEIEDIMIPDEVTVEETPSTSSGQAPKVEETPSASSGQAPEVKEEVSEDKAKI
jgi:single-strand DNA-binding protein